MSYPNIGISPVEEQYNSIQPERKERTMRHIYTDIDNTKLLITDRFGSAFDLILSVIEGKDMLEIELTPQAVKAMVEQLSEHLENINYQ